MDVNFAIRSLQTDGGSRHPHRSTRDLHSIEVIHITRTIEFIRNQRFQISIRNHLLAIRQFLETHESLIQFNFIQ